MGLAVGLRLAETASIVDLEGADRQERWRDPRNIDGYIVVEVLDLLPRADDGREPANPFDLFEQGPCVIESSD